MKTREIKALSDKLNFDIRITKHCLKDVFSKDSSVIDHVIVTKKDVMEFLRICAFSKSKEERTKLFYTGFLPRFTKKDPRKTIVYFIRDYFFSAILAFLDNIENINYNQRFELFRIDNESRFYFTMLSTEYMHYWILNDRKSLVVGNLLVQIMDSIDLGSEDIDFDPERKFIVNLSSEIVQDLGYQMFLVDMIRDAFVDSEEMGKYKMSLNKTSYGLMSHNQDKRIDYIFIYCLCDTLKESGYQAENIYKSLTEIVYMDAKSIRRRYFEIKREMKEKGLNYKTLIKIHNLQHRIYYAERTVKSNLMITK